jgi:hypothetical protein
VQRFAGFELPRILVPAIASRLGITRARIRTEVGRGNWQTIARGVVLTRPDEPTREDWAGVGIAVGGPTAALSGWDAVRIRGLGDPTPPVCTVLVLIRDGRSRLVGSAWVRRTGRPYLVETTSAHAGLHPLTPVVPTARAIADAALTYSALGPVRAMVTSAVQRNACSLVELVRELDDGPQNGSYFLRRALRAAAFGAHSEAEAAATDKLVRAEVPPFELNVPIVDERGAVIFVVDVLWRELRAALEIDSREFHFSDAGWRATLDRHNKLTRSGLAVTHYPPSVVNARDCTWTAEVAEWLRCRATELGVALPPGRGPISPAIGADPPPFLVRIRRG